MSWRFRKIVEPQKSYGWHRHDEYELAIHRNFSGSCFAGNTQTTVEHNHIVLFGPRLPHAIYSDSQADQQRCETYVLWFRRDWIESMLVHCHELELLRPLLNDARQGIEFSSHTAEQIVKLLDEVMLVPPHRQLLVLMNILCLLVEDTERKRLIGAPEHLDAAPDSQESRTDKAERYLTQHFAHAITQKDLAQHLYISESGVRRLFQTHFKESFSQRLKKIRLNVASDLLANTQLPISIVMEKVGFTNQANFNRHFKTYKKVTPSEYRKQVQI
ncbi:transcriptional regulator AraC family [Vibrio astriarenae]|nr:transcriptional regulator AraC family [Vibrio sp. C7]